MAPCPPTILG